MLQIHGNPVRPEEFSEFLRRERQALTRRRNLLAQNWRNYIPPSKNQVELIAQASELREDKQFAFDLECRNETFRSQRQATEAGFDVVKECRPNEDCNCDCNFVDDVICSEDPEVIGHSVEI